MPYYLFQTKTYLAIRFTCESNRKVGYIQNGNLLVKDELKEQLPNNMNWESGEFRAGPESWLLEFENNEQVIQWLINNNVEIINCIQKDVVGRIKKTDSKKTIKYKFNTDKIISYLKAYKDDLHQLYNWNVKLDGLVEMKIINKNELKELNKKNTFYREITLKKKLNFLLKQSYINDKEKFYKLCLWIVKDWGGIKTGSEAAINKLVEEFLNSEKQQYKRIASTSKVGAFMYPEKFLIYDSRVAYSLNWIILSEGAGKYFFPIPSGRNSKMMAFNMDVLIRLKKIDNYRSIKTSELENKQYINNKDKTHFIPKKEAYFELTKLVKEINNKLWKEDKWKEMLYFTEMLLFAIADRQIYNDITKRVSLIINKDK